VEDTRAPWLQEPSLEHAREQPLATLEAEILHPAGQPGLQAWLVPGAAMVAIGGDAAGMHPQEVMALLPPLLGLGPRHGARLGVRTTRQGLQDFLAAGVDAHAPGEEAELLRALAADDLRHWRVTARWGDDGVRGVEVLDATEQGIWLVVAEDDESVALMPTTTSAVWRLLTTLLPFADEL